MMISVMVRIFSSGFNGVNGLNGQNKGEQADCPRCGRLAWLGLGGGEVEDVDGVAFGVMGGVFEGEFVVGEGVVGGRLHQAVDKNGHGIVAIRRFGECDFSGEVHAVDGEDRRIGKGNVFLRGHDLAAGEGEADDGLGGGTCAGGVGGVDTCDREGCLGDLDGGALLGDGRDILACFCAAAGDGLECAAYGVAYGIVDFLTC